MILFALGVMGGQAGAQEHAVPATRQDPMRYAAVDDLVFDRRGDVRTVVVDADASGPPGRYAFPWPRDRFSLDGNPHPLPYERRQIAHLGPLDFFPQRLAR